MRSKSVRLTLVATLVGILLATACSTTPTAPTTSVGSPASQPTAAATPTPARPSGTLRVAWSYQDVGRVHEYGNAGAGKGSAIYDSFLKLTSDGQLAPGLAERWEISADGLTHTFYLRKGVKFHDGSDLTGEDAKFSLERIMDPKVVHASNNERASWPKQIDSIEVKDGYTVILHLKQPQFRVLAGFERPGFTASTMVLSKKYVQERGEDYLTAHPMGSGAWKVVNYVPGDRLELEANENYWGEIPKFKNLTILNLTEESTKVAMLKTGELDLAQVAPDSVAGLKAAGLRVSSFDGQSRLYSVSWYDLSNPEKQPLGNVKVRTAISLAVNRQELANTLFAGYAKPGFAFQVPPTAYFFDANTMKPDPFDPDRAKKLIAEAGYPSGFNVTVWDTSAGGIGSTSTQALAAYWRKVGIEAKITPIQYSAFTPLWLAGPAKPEVWNTIQPGTSGGNLWQDESLASIYHSAGSYHNINIPELDKLLDSLPLIKDQAERKQVAAKIAIMGQQNHAHISYLDIETILAIGPKIGEFTPVKGGASMWGPVYATITHAK
ncbi:MAG: ABC transporter substrate-binding protein [Chloroflexi bacterium]|nr:ABC transporter substrate-binding protein [Chloroflexota bacterium]